jgi:hypothetical protein
MDRNYVPRTTGHDVVSVGSEENRIRTFSSPTTLCRFSSRSHLEADARVHEGTLTATTSLVPFTRHRPLTVLLRKINPDTLTWP